MGSGSLGCMDERNFVGLVILECLGGWRGAFSALDLCLFRAVFGVTGEEGDDHFGGPYPPLIGESGQKFVFGNHALG